MSKVTRTRSSRYATLGNIRGREKKTTAKRVFPRLRNAVLPPHQHRCVQKPRVASRSANNIFISGHRLAACSHTHLSCYATLRQQLPCSHLYRAVINGENDVAQIYFCKHCQGAQGAPLPCICVSVSVTFSFSLSLSLAVRWTDPTSP